MIKWIISCLYFFLPAYFTNVTPPLSKNLGLLNSFDKPIDFNKTIKGKPVFGSHKTWRGLVLGLTIGFLTVHLQAFLYQYPAVKEISFLDYEKENLIVLALFLSAGDLMGDLISAFFKRRLNLKPGAKFIPFDQTNYVISNALLFSLTGFFEIDIFVWPTLFVLTFFLHIIINRLGYHLKIHQAKW